MLNLKKLKNGGTLNCKHYSDSNRRNGYQLFVDVDKKGYDLGIKGAVKGCGLPPMINHHKNTKYLIYTLNNGNQAKFKINYIN